MEVKVSEGALFIDNNKIDNSSFKNLEFVDLLGEGANGFTFLVRHKVLDINQVVKIYKSSDTNAIEKGIEESKKNSNPDLRDVIARVYDAGTLDVCADKKVYSIMDFIGSSLTLKQWLECRDYAYSSVKSDVSFPNRMEDLEKYFIQDSLNVTASFLYSVSKLLKNDITHGDLNVNNIFIQHNYYSAELYRKINEDKISIDNAVSYHSRPGSLESNNIPITFIDLGTSNIEGTDQKVGMKRDSYFIFDIARRLMKPLFQTSGVNMSLKSFVKDRDIIFREGYAQDFVYPLEIASELLRFLMFTNLILNLNSVDGEELAALNDLISGECSENIRRLGLDIFDTRVQEAYEYYMSSNKHFDRKSIDWRNFLNFVEGSFKKEFLNDELVKKNLILE